MKVINSCEIFVASSLVFFLAHSLYNLEGGNSLTLTLCLISDRPPHTFMDSWHLDHGDRPPPAHPPLMDPKVCGS